MESNDDREENLLEHLWQTIGIPKTALGEASFKLLARQILAAAEENRPAEDAWDGWIEPPSTGPERTIRVELEYIGRDVPLPYDDE